MPKYGALLEFLNFVVLFVIFVLALSSKLRCQCLLHEDENVELIRSCDGAEQDKNAMNVFEVVFIVFASAFTLAEYTASQEHGWGSESMRIFTIYPRGH